MYKRQDQLRAVGAQRGQARVIQAMTEFAGQRIEAHEDLGLSLIHISRAHETVLDLVCRLLLEKKPTKSSNQITR